MNKVNVLGVEFDNVTMQEALDRCQKFMESKKGNMIVTPNPEIVMLARKDESFRKNINSADLVIPDGIGVIKAANILKTPLKGRVPGYELICNILESEKITNKKV